MGVVVAPESAGGQRPDHVESQNYLGVHSLPYPYPVLNTSTRDNYIRDRACLEGKALTVLPRQVQ